MSMKVPIEIEMCGCVCMCWGKEGVRVLISYLFYLIFASVLFPKLQNLKMGQ